MGQPPLLLPVAGVLLPTRLGGIEAVMNITMTKHHDPLPLMMRITKITAVTAGRVPPLHIRRLETEGNPHDQRVVTRKVSERHYHRKERRSTVNFMMKNGLGRFELRHLCQCRMTVGELIYSHAYRPLYKDALSLAHRILKISVQPKSAKCTRR